MTSIRKGRPHSAVSIVSEKVRILAQEKSAHEKLPTLSDLCAFLGTSRSTLVEALDELELQNVVYRHPGKGVFVSPHIHNKTICILLDSAYLAMGISSFWGNVWGACAQTAQRRAVEKQESHLFHMLSRQPGQEALMPPDIIRMIDAQLIHGFISIGLRTYIPELLTRPIDTPQTVAEVITQSGLPCVTFTHYGRWSIEQDYYHLVSLALQRLAEQGCQHIGLWYPHHPESEQQQHALLHFFSYLLNACNLPFEPALVQCGSPEQQVNSQVTSSLQEQGYRIAMHVFDNPSTPKPDGIIIMDDMLTNGALMAFLQKHEPILEKTKVVTHANTGSLPFFERIPGVSVIEFDAKEITSEMFSMLDRLLHHETPEHNGIRIRPKFRIL